MPWHIASFISLLLSVIINATCLYFRRSRRGILIFHWCVINWLTSMRWNDFVMIGHQNPFNLLLPIASLLLAADQLFMETMEDTVCDDTDCIFLISSLIAFDAFVLTFDRFFKYEMCYVTLIAMICVFFMLLNSGRKNIPDINYLRQNSAYCFFNDYMQPFNCFGEYGYIIYVALFCNVLQQVIPVLQYNVAFNYFVYFFLSIGTINFIRTPVYIGGWIQSIKQIGAGIITGRNQYLMQF